MNEKQPSVGDVLQQREAGEKHRAGQAESSRSSTNERLEKKFNPFLNKFGKILAIQQNPHEKEYGVYSLVFRDDNIIKIKLDQNGDLEFAQTGHQEIPMRSNDGRKRDVHLQQVHNLEDLQASGYVDTLKEQIARGVIWSIFEDERK